MGGGARRVLATVLALVPLCDAQCTQETSCPESGGGQYAGKSACISASKPASAPLRGSVGCVDETVLATRPTATVGGQDRAASNIYGPLEAGFTSSVPGMSCLGENTIDAGIDTKTAEGMVEVLCPDTTVEVLDSCGGHAVPYHYHEHMSCLFNASTTTGTVGHSTRVGTALDGNGIYGNHITGGSVPTDLDACGGRVGVTPDSGGAEVYYYVITDNAPFTVGCFGSKDEYPVSIASCRALYPDECDDTLKVCIETTSGAGYYNKECPCYDPTTGSNVLSQEEIPGYMAGGASLGAGCSGDNDSKSSSFTMVVPTFLHIVTMSILGLMN